MFLVLAVAYGSGKILLADIENSSSIHTFQTGSKPTLLLWSPQSKSASHDTECFRDLSSEFLPKLPAFEKGYCAHDVKFCQCCHLFCFKKSPHLCKFLLHIWRMCKIIFNVMFGFKFLFLLMCLVQIKIIITVS